MKEKVLLFASFVTSTFSYRATYAESYTQDYLTGRVVHKLLSEGFVIQDTAETGLLDAGQSHTFTIASPCGAEVVLVASGEGDANNVDMVVRGGESGRIVSANALQGATPVCHFASQGGSYRVTVKVVDAGWPTRVRVIYAVR